MLNNLNNSTGCADTADYNCLQCQIDEVKNSLSNLAATDIAIQNEIDGFSDNVTTNQIEACNMNVAAANTGTLTSTTADIKYANIECACISKLGNISAECITADSINASSITGVSKLDTVTIANACISCGVIEKASAECMTADNLISSCSSISNANIDSAAIKNADITNLTSNVTAADIAANNVTANNVTANHIKSESANIASLASDNISASVVNSSNIAGCSKLNTCRYMTIESFNGIMQLADDNVNVIVAGQDGSYNISFSNSAPDNIILFAANKDGLTIEFSNNHCVTYSITSSNSPLITTSDNHTYRDDDVVIATCNNLWSKHSVILQACAADSGVCVTGLIEADKIKTQSCSYENVYINSSLTSTKCNVLGDLTVYPYVLAEGCCSDGYIKVCDDSSTTLVCPQGVYTAKVTGATIYSDFAEYDGNVWKAHGVIECACCDCDGNTIPATYVRCCSNPVISATVSTTDDVSTITVKQLDNTTCSYTVDSKAVIECSELPESPANKVYNVGECVYSKSTELATKRYADSKNYICCGNNCIAASSSINSITGNLKVTGDITISGNIYQEGDSYSTHAQDLYTCNDVIKVRDGAQAAIADMAGLQVLNYNGCECLNIGVDSTGTLSVGDIGNEKPVLLREAADSMAEGNALVWDSSSKTAKTTDSVPKAISDCNGNVISKTYLTQAANPVKSAVYADKTLTVTQVDGSCNCYTIDADAVIECSELPESPANKVYNVGDCVYSKSIQLQNKITGCYACVASFSDGVLCLQGVEL